MPAFQLILSSPNARPWGLAVATVRSAVRTITRVIGKHLLAFHVSDTHVHVVVLASRARAGRLAQALSHALAARFGGRISGAAVRPVRDVGHLDWLVTYVLCNDDRHGVLPDPWRENSNLPDLRGLRLTTAATIPRVRLARPRLRREMLLAMADWPALDPARALNPQVVRAELADAAAAVFALARLGGKSRSAQAALNAACRVAARAGLRPKEAAELLGVSRSTYHRQGRSPPNDRAERALARQLHLREVVPRPDEPSFSEDAPHVSWEVRRRLLKE